MAKTTVKFEHGWDPVSGDPIYLEETFEIDNPDVLNRSLPKWPACIIIGDKVTEEQAAEIIFRTDYSFPDFEYATNARDKAQTYSDVFGIPRLPREQPRNHIDRVHALSNELKVLRLEYLINARIMSSYIGGPNGWCNWDGTIHQDSKNIGKWPSIEVVLYEWSIIARAFPFLNLRCQLLNCESCEVSEKKPRVVVEYTVANGEVSIRTPADDEKPMAVGNDDVLLDAMACAFTDPAKREFGISHSDYLDKLHSVYGEELPQYTLSGDSTKTMTVDLPIQATLSWSMEIPEDANTEEVFKQFSIFLTNQSQYGIKVKPSQITRIGRQSLMQTGPVTVKDFQLNDRSRGFGGNQEACTYEKLQQWVAANPDKLK